MFWILYGTYIIRCKIYQLIFLSLSCNHWASKERQAAITKSMKVIFRWWSGVPKHDFYYSLKNLNRNFKKASQLCTSEKLGHGNDGTSIIFYIKIYYIIMILNKHNSTHTGWFILFYIIYYKLLSNYSSKSLNMLIIIDNVYFIDELLTE